MVERKTIVAFTSDNGADSKPDRHGNAEKGSNLPLKGWKGSSDEGGVRVPFVVTWPGTLPAGKETGEMASLMDILPTFAALAGIEPKTPQKIDGKDIFKRSCSVSDVKSPHQYIYYAGNISRITGVRNDRFKLNNRGLCTLRSPVRHGETKDVRRSIRKSCRSFKARSRTLRRISVNTRWMHRTMPAKLSTKRPEKESDQRRNAKRKRSKEHR